MREASQSYNVVVIDMRDSSQAQQTLQHRLRSSAKTIHWGMRLGT